MSHTVITLALIPAALYLLLASTTCSHASELYDISDREYNASVYEAAVFGGTRRVSYDRSRNWCNITFKFVSSWKPKNSSQWIYPSRFSFRIDYLYVNYDTVKLELTQYGTNGQNCTPKGGKPLISINVYSGISSYTLNFTTGKNCVQKLSIYQSNLYSTANYKTQVIVTPHIDCNISSSSTSTSLYPYKCERSGECISNSLQCDGFRNCIEGYDENSWCKPPSWWMTTKPSTTIPRQPTTIPRQPPQTTSGNPETIYWVVSMIGLFIFIGAIVVTCCCGNEKNRTSDTRTSSPRQVSPTSTQRPAAGTAPIYHSSASASIAVDATAPPAYENVALDVMENRVPFEEPPPSYEQFSKQINRPPTQSSANRVERTMCPVESSRN